MESNPFVQHQFPSRCPGRFTVVHDDMHGAGLGWTAKLLTFALIISRRQGRILVEGDSARRWCTHDPGTLLCYYRPWSNCSLAAASHVRNLSLALFHRKGVWHGMSASTTDLQPAAFQLLFRPRDEYLLHVERLIAQCGGDDFWTVHVRDSPEKRRERGKLPSFDKYVARIPNGTKRVLWQTSNPSVFGQMMLFARSSRLPHHCYTNATRHTRDAWGGRNASLNDESALTGVVNGEAARRGSGCISLGSSMWTWFITVGTKQRVVLL